MIREYKSYHASLEERIAGKRLVAAGVQNVETLVRLLNGEQVKETGPSSFDDTTVLRSASCHIGIKAGREVKFLSIDQVRNLIDIEKYGKLLYSATHYLSTNDSSIVCANGKWVL